MVWGAILDKYLALGGPAVLNFPTSDELAAGAGRFNTFLGGNVYWSPSTGAHEVHGEILSEYGGPTNFLGYPITDETGTPDGTGRFNHFTGGSIYWTPGTGAHEIHGAIRDHWAQLGWERGPLGYPRTDEYDIPTGRRSDFAHGAISWDRATGVVTVTG